MDTDASLAQEPGSPERRYEIVFVDGSVHTVRPDTDHDVSAVGESLIIYAPGRRTTFPWHRIRAVTLYGWDQPPA
jgi:hypothetical protein